MKKIIYKLIFAISACLFVFCGCTSKGIETYNIEDEAVALSSSPEALTFDVEQKALHLPKGIKEKKNDNVIIDYSSVEEGFIHVSFTNKNEKRIKAQVKGPTATYTYNINPLEWEILPLSDGNGNYQVTVYENIKDSRYSVVAGVSFDVELKDEFAPFLNPNQYVDFTDSPETIKKAGEIVSGIKEPIKKVEKVYDYVVDNLTYDYEKAKTVKSGYLPVLDEILDYGKGICFDYAALMTAMLRSEGVPCKLVVGYAGTVYHAWISVWTEETGWIDGVIYFDGKMWHRMDPTFASSGGKSDTVMEYISEGKNYTAKYFY